MPLPVVIHAGQWLPAMCRDRTASMYGANLRIIFVSVHVLCAKKEKDVAQRHIQRLCPLLIFAHCAQNVSFVADNVNGRGGANRSATARRRGENAFRHHCLGDRFSCKRYRKSCNAYCDRPIACARPRRRGRFSGKIRRIFREFNGKVGVGFDFYKKRHKTKASCLRYFRQREWAVGFAAILGVNGC